MNRDYPPAWVVLWIYVSSPFFMVSVFALIALAFQR